MNTNFVDHVGFKDSRLTSDGYMVADVLCARTGCQTYLASDIEPGRSGLITVYRPESAVFAKDSLATFVGKPVTVGHPAENVTADNWKTYAVGDIGEEIARDGEYVRVSIKLMDAAAINAVRGGTREISMGYSTPVLMIDGVAPDGTPYQAVQTGPIRINHLAIVKAARGGSNLRIGDEADNWGASPFTKSIQKEDIMSDALKTVVVGDKAISVSLDSVATIEAFKVDSAKALADAAVANDKAIATKDAEIAKKDAEIADLKKKILSDADIDARVQARADLLARVAKVADGVETKGLSDAAIKRAAVVKVRGAEMADKSDAYIDAAFDLLEEQKDKKDPLKGAAASGSNHKDSGNDDNVTGYEAYKKRLGDAWKGESK